MNEFLKAARKMAGPQSGARIFPGSMALPEIPPAPLYERGVGGDFRDGPAKHDFLAIFKIFHFDRACDESRTFRTKHIFWSAPARRRFSEACGLVRNRAGARYRAF